MFTFKVCDMEGRSMTYRDKPSFGEVLSTFSKHGRGTVLFHQSTPEQPLQSFDQLEGGGECVVYAVYLSEHATWLRKALPSHVAELFGGYAVLEKWPKMPWQQTFLGTTDYIDGICVRDFGDNRAMFGVDCYQRMFVTFVVQKTDGSSRVGTVFQRYTGNLCTWAFAGVLPFNGDLTEYNRKSLRELFSDDGHKPYSNLEEVWESDCGVSQIDIRCLCNNK
jgi:hypothetical protein